MSQYETGRRAAKIRLSPRAIEHMLDLPKGLRVTQVYTLHDPVTIYLVVEGETLERQSDDCELPFLGGGLVRNQRVDSAGRLWTALEWTMEEL